MQILFEYSVEFFNISLDPMDIFLLLTLLGKKDDSDDNNKRS